MQIETISPRRAVDNAFLQETITEAEFETFRERLLKLLSQADDAVEEGESEEHLKNLIKPFFSNTNFEEDYYINTKERQDLAIHNDIRDKIRNIGQWLGFDANIERRVAAGSQVDTVWEQVSLKCDLGFSKFAFIISAHLALTYLSQS